MVVFGGFKAHTVNHDLPFDTSVSTWAFNPATGLWRQVGDMPTAANRPLEAVWTGQVAVLFAGGEGGHPATFEYDPTNDTWSPGYAPLPGGSRISPSVVWTGGEVVAWGGVDDAKAVVKDPRAPLWNAPLASSRADGYAYSPATHKWTPIKTAPVSAVDPATTWTGTDWVVYGGTQVTAGVATPVPGGYSYDPGTDTWTALPAAPFKGLSGPVAAWTGDTLVVWGRDIATAGGGAPKGAVYDPVAASWAAMDASSQVAGRGSVAVWTGPSMLVVGGGKPGEATAGHTQHVAEWKPSE
jgi:N-acetylneuraminic acid mutarotase